MKRILLYGSIGLILTSCSVQKQTTNTAKTLDIYGSGVIQSPVITNLVVNPKKFTSSYSGVGIQDIPHHKSQAIAKAMEENKSDVIIEPTFEIVTTSTSIKITTTGYSGAYKNFRTMTGADTSLLVDAGIINYNNNSAIEPIYKQQKKKGKGGLIVLAILLVIGAVAQAL